MNKQTKNDFPCCQVEAVIPVDKRGQMVLPKAVRDKAGLKAGDKLAVISLQNGEKSCCLALMKAKDLEETVKGILGPLMEKVVKK